VLVVVEAPDPDPVHEQRIVSDGVRAAWIEHVDEGRGWGEVVSEFAAQLDGIVRGACARTDGGHSKSDSEDADDT
jgi:hypothetical protein